MALLLCAACSVPLNINESNVSGDRCKYTGQSVRALPIRVITVGKKRSRGVQLLVDEYSEKVKYYCSFQDVQLRSNPRNARYCFHSVSDRIEARVSSVSNEIIVGGIIWGYFNLEHNDRDAKAQIEDEDKAVLNLISSDDWVIMLDEAGLEIGSNQMAELIGDAGMTGASRVSFCIGGPYGHGRLLRERANKSVKLSSLVLNHQVALVVLMEQVYRSWTILKGQKYHH